MWLAFKPFARFDWNNSDLALVKVALRVIKDEPYRMSDKRQSRLTR
jgi:hypothetical protein